MSEISIRPRFRLQTDLPKEDFLQKISNALAQPDAPFKGVIVDHHVILKIPVESRHYWSPQLELDVEDKKQGSLIRGLFGPQPSVWFMYIFFYSVLAFVSMVVMIMGFSQLNLGLSARILWILPITGVLFIFAFSTAKAGQRLGSDEMKALHGFLMKVVKE